MAIWDDILTGNLSLNKVWLRLDQEVRLAAGKAFYEHDWEDGGVKLAQADGLVAAVLRFRPIAVRQIPVERRARSLALSTRPDADLVSSLLTAYHFEIHREMMGAFLDALAIPHEKGLIQPEHEIQLADDEKLAAAVDGLYKAYPAEQVDLYLATLYMADPRNWRALGEVVKRRTQAA